MSSDGTGQDWRSNADTHKMLPEDVKKYGVGSSKRPPGQHPGGVLHQRRIFPYSPTAMAGVGFILASIIGCVALYVKSKPGTTHEDVAKAVTGEEGSHIN